MNKLKISWKLFRKKPFIENIKQWGTYSFMFIGALLSLKELAELIGFDIYFVKFKLFFLIVLGLAILSGGVLTIFSHYRLLNQEFFWKDNMRLHVVVNNYFDTLEEFPKGVAVCGVNDTFQSENLAKGSLHQEIYERYFNEIGHQEFDKHVIAGIKGTVKKSSANAYPLSTVAVVDVKGPQNDEARKWLMLANSSRTGEEAIFNGKNITLADTSSLWTTLKERGLFADPLVMPLIGTGNSQDNSPMSAVFGIIDQFFRYSYLNNDGIISNTPIVKSLVISIPLAFVSDEKIDLELVHKYIIMKNNLMDYRYIREGRYKKIIENKGKTETTS